MAAGQQNDFKIGAVIQARMQSSRLPGKILLPLPFNSKNVLLSWPVQQLKKSKFIKKIILATSVNHANNVLKRFAEEQEIFFYAGSEDNVLSRFVEAANDHQLEIIIRITGDNPIIDERLVDELIMLHLKGDFDYSYSVDLPIGMNVEVIKVGALQEVAMRKDLIQQDEEHVTYFFKRQNSNKVLQHNFKSDVSNDLRLTVDYPADYAMLNIIAEVSKKNNLYGIELIKFLETNYKWIFNINAHLNQKKQYTSLKEEVADSCNMLQMQEFKFTLDFLKNKLNEA